jgi:hypothetical protein
MNHTEQKIKELEELANEFNNKLKDLREEAKREEFKVGDWVVFTGKNGWVTEFWTPGKVCKINEIDGNVLRTDGSTSSGASNLKSNFRKATPSEIEKHLIEEAEKKGFIKGAKVRMSRQGGNASQFGGENPYNLDWRNIAFTITGETRLFYGQHGNEYIVCFGLDFQGYKYFAYSTFIELTSSSPNIKIGSNKVEFHSDHIQVGCTRVELETIEQIYKHFKK